MTRRPALRFRTAAVTAALSATALVGGGFAIALNTGAPAQGIALTQQKLDSTMTVGKPVDVDLKAVAAQAAGGQVPDGAALTVTGLPEGVVQDGWHLTGTPTRAGTYDVLVTFEVAGQTASQTVPLTVQEAGAAAAAPTTTAEAGTEPAGDDETTTAEAPATTVTGAPEDGVSPAAEPAATATTATTSPTFAAQTRCSTAGGSVDPAALIGAAGPALGLKGDQSVLAGILATIVKFLPQLMGQDAGSLSCATPATTGATTAGALGEGAATTSPSTTTPATTTPAAAPAGDLLTIVGPLLGVDTSSLGGR